MPSIVTVKRLVKRVIVSNLATEKIDLYLTPLISGKHGIGKSQIIKSIAKEIDGICYTIEGGTLKEGEITGIPYQYSDEEGNIHFRFLPYYVIENIQKLEKDYETSHLKLDNLSSIEKIDAILSKKVKPVIVFIDEINRTDNAVYKELMNILLTRIVNGYKLPWWVFFVAAMNPSNDDSSYQTNEMDPAQLDRFFKISAKENLQEWVTYAKNTEMDSTILEFVKTNGDFLSAPDEGLVDDEEGTPSPRGWDMIDTIVKARNITKPFFSDAEQSQMMKDIKTLIEVKVGKKIALMYFKFLSQVQMYLLDEFLSDDDTLSNFLALKPKLTTAAFAVLINDITNYLKNNIVNLKLDTNEFNKMVSKLNCLLKNIDKSTALLFIQNVINEKDINNAVLFPQLKEVFDAELLEMLNVTMNSLSKLKKE